jgi:hypothetical protein
MTPLVSCLNCGREFEPGPDNAECCSVQCETEFAEFPLDDGWDEVLGKDVLDV